MLDYVDLAFSQNL